MESKTGTSITITFPTLPAGRTAVMLFGNSNSDPFFTIIAVEAKLSGVVATVDWISCSADPGTKTVTISGLPNWGKYYAICPDREIS